MAPLSNCPLVELLVEDERTGRWRQLVFSEDTVLFCLHRAVQHAFKPSSQDAAIERQDLAFSFCGAALGRIKSLALSDAPLGEDFLSGGCSLKYAAGGAAYKISAGRRGLGDIKHYVPRCIAGSPDADLDGANSKLLVRRYGKNHTNNKQKKDAPRMWAGPTTTNAQLVRAAMNRMLQRVA